MTDVKDVLIENQELHARNEFLERMVKGLKLNLSKTTLERNQAIDELNRIKAMSMFEFSSKYSTVEQQEADGRAFARELLGGA